MLYYINCPRCNNKTSLDFTNNLEQINLTCSNCNTHIIMSSRGIKKFVRKKVIKLNCSSSNVFNDNTGTDEKYESEKQCTGVSGFLKKSYDACEKIYNKLSEEYSTAESRLYKQGIDDWDESKLENHARYSGFFEEAIIRQRLRNIKKASTQTVGDD